MVKKSASPTVVSQPIRQASVAQSENSPSKLTGTGRKARFADDNGWTVQRVLIQDTVFNDAQEVAFKVKN